MSEAQVGEVVATRAASPTGKRGAPPLQTLERGLRVLELLATEGPSTLAEVAAATGLHRSIVYRILRTLEQREFAERDENGRFSLGLAAAPLGHAVRRDLRTAALPELTQLAASTRCTAFVVVPHGGDAVTLLTVEPPHAAGEMVYRPGWRHPLTRGAPGLAILAALPARPDERPEVALARTTGYVRSTGDVIAGLSALAAPVRLRDGSGASVAIVFVAGHVDEASAIEHLRRAASRVAAAAAHG